MSILPALIGFLLWLGATCLLIGDVVIDGHSFTLTHALQPCLTASTVAAAVYCHHRLASLRLISGTAFLALALIGSGATIYGTLSRTATARDAAQAEAMAENRTLAFNEVELKTARADAVKECKSGFGPRCRNAKERVDQLVATMSSLRVVSIDPRADALGRLADLVGLNGAKTREIVGVLDPVILPLFLELGSLIFFSVAFPHKRRNRQRSVNTHEDAATVASAQLQTVTAPLTVIYSQNQALADYKRLKQAPGQHVLATRWGVSRGTVSRWMKAWEDAGLVSRQRSGKEKASVLMLPAPAKRKLLGTTVCQ